MAPWEYEGKDTANIPVGMQDTSHVAGEVLAEQQGEDIFNPKTPAEIIKLIGRLDEIRDELGVLFAKMYPQQKTYNPYSGPAYREREELQERCDALHKEEREIQGYLSMVYEGYDTGGERGAISYVR